MSTTSSAPILNVFGSMAAGDPAALAASSPGLAGDGCPARGASAGCETVGAGWEGVCAVARVANIRVVRTIIWLDMTEATWALNGPNYCTTFHLRRMIAVPCQP